MTVRFANRPMKSKDPYGRTVRGVTSDCRAVLGIFRLRIRFVNEPDYSAQNDNPRVELNFYIEFEDDFRREIY